jgi:putative ABC transport system permease protein
MAMTLLVGGGLMMQSFERLQKIELGFRPDNLLVMEMALSADKYGEHDKRVAFTTQALEQIRSLPGVVSAGATTNIPLQSGSFDSVFTVEGRPQANPSDVPITAHRLVSPGYLETLGVNLVKGRLLDEGDRADTLPVAVISEELARQAWPGQEAIGKRIRRGRAHQTNFPWMTVVGVVSDVKEDRYNFRINRPAWYLPYAQHANNRPVNLLVQTSGDAATLTASVRNVVGEIDPDQPLSPAMVMNDHLANVIVTERFSAVLMGTLAALGLLLAALGLYGVMAYSVTERTGELGLRQALGARPGDIFRLVIRQGLTLVLIGLVAGLAAALALTRFLSGALYEVSPTDPATFAVIALILAVVALLACYIPARRATRVDPIVALRYE